MMLSAQHLQLLTELLDDERSTMEAVVNHFRQGVPNKTDHFTFLSAIHVLVQDNLLISPLQKIVAYYLLYALHPGTITSNPFFLVFLTVLESPTSDLWERNFCSSFLDGLPKEVANKTSKQVFEWSESIETPEVDIASLMESYEASMSISDPYSAIGVPNTWNIVGSSQSGPEQNDANWKERVQANDFSLETMKPYLLRPRPPILEPSREEAIWINPSIPLGPPTNSLSQTIWFEWDSTMGRLPPNEQSEAIELLNEAFTGPLSREQTTKLITELRASPEILRDCNFTPQVLGQLVETNPKVAIQALVELVQCIGPDLVLSSNASYSLVDYWMVLVNIPTNKHSMEVVSSICSAVELPTEYLHLYISNCISTCQQTKDSIAQSRLVAMCCVFLQTLIRNKILKVTDIFIEVESFCITFSKIPGAATLYRLLRQMQ